MSKFGKTNNNNAYDAKKTKLEDDQQLVETSRTFKCNDFVNLNMKNVANIVDKKSLDKLKDFVKEGKYFLCSF